MLQNNCYIAHTESIFLAAIGDTNKQKFRFATEKILVERHNTELATSDIRQIDKKAIVLNSMANSYLDLIDWTKCIVTPPPLLFDISDDDLISNKQILLPHIPWTLTS